MDRNLALLLRDAARWHPDRAAIIEGERTTSYRALFTRAMAIAAALAECAIMPGDPVAIMLERGADAAEAFFGVLAMGGVAVLVNETYRARQVDHILAHSGARLLLTTPDRLALLPRPLEATTPLLDPRILADAGGAHTPGPRADDDPAQIIYTSGSTGSPKGVVVTHGNLHAATRTVAEYLRLRHDDRIAAVLPFTFVYGMSQLLCSIGTGATLVVERGTLPQEIVRSLQAQRISVLAAVPPIWNRLLAAGGFAEAPMPALRIMTNAGGHLPVPLVRTLRRAHPGAELFLMYGLTEVLRSTYLPPDEVDAHPDSIGRAIPGSEVLVLGPDGEEVPPGEIGELVHCGPTVTAGYWNDPVRTAEVFRADPRPHGNGRPAVYSGDLVRKDEEGRMYYVSRRDRLIKTMGLRVGPDEVLNVLLASGQLREGVVHGEPDPEWGERIVAHVVLAPRGTVAKLRAFCQRELPRHMQPARYEVVTTLPLLPSGKYDLESIRTPQPA